MAAAAASTSGTNVGWLPNTIPLPASRMREARRETTTRVPSSLHPALRSSSSSGVAPDSPTHENGRDVSTTGHLDGFADLVRAADVHRRVDALRQLPTIRLERLERVHQEPALTARVALAHRSRGVDERMAQHRAVRRALDEHAEYAMGHKRARARLLGPVE